MRAPNCERHPEGDRTLDCADRQALRYGAGLEVLPRRWVVERTLAGLGRCRRLSKDWDKSIAGAQAWILNAHIRRVTRYLARS